ncbi:hypothetical protein [Rhizobium wenxiniae]|uniref:hypothetical protein n=1 Tax=Rhizobium wenxiniae TaxID=1737357 RepID=UPI003C2884CF
MRVERIINLLHKASPGLGPLDALVAQAVGWRKMNGQTADDKTGEVHDCTLWLMPNSENPGRISHCTSNIDAACLLVQQACLSRASGFSRQESSATAQMGENDPRASTATPGLALCLATIMACQSEVWPQ